MEVDYFLVFKLDSDRSYSFNFHLRFAISECDILVRAIVLVKRLE